MKIEYHPLVSRDPKKILAWYDERSETAADRFFKDSEQTVEKLRRGLTQGIQIDKNCAKVFLKKFPYTLTYEAEANSIYIFIVKHQKRHQNLGMRRARPSQSK